MRFILMSFFVFLCLPHFQNALSAPEKPHGCREITYQNIAYTLCTYDARKDDIRLFHTGKDGRPYGQFTTLAKALKAGGKTLSFAMNAGMYHQDRSPVGYYVENGNEMVPLNMGSGKGNFFLKPNGVFFLENKQVGVWDTARFKARKSRASIRFATQSGPMLVIKGAIHKSLSPTSLSKYRRNGVGVMADKRTVHFLISSVAVNFHTFARVFKDRLHVSNALYLDGFVSRIYAPSIGKNETGRELGPIVGVVEPLK